MFRVAQAENRTYSLGMENTPQNQDTLRGFGFALAAYFIWGFLPFYMKQLAHIPTLEVLAHRVIWSVPIAAIILATLGRTGDIKRALSDPKVVGMAAITAAIISLNWGVYVWAIGSNHALEAALGYYINPLLSVALGALLLKEKLSAAQRVAVALAGLAVVVLTVDAGRLPAVAVALPLSWAAYAFLKKWLPVGPNIGFFLEVLLLTPFAAAYVAYSYYNGSTHFMQSNPWDTALLMGCGVVTAVPLMLYANGAKLLRLSTIGIMQYIAPTMIFLTAVFVFGEAFDTVHKIAFAMIWAALVIYTWSFIAQARKH